MSQCQLCRVYGSNMIDVLEHVGAVTKIMSRSNMTDVKVDYFRSNEQ